MCTPEGVEQLQQIFALIHHQKSRSTELTVLNLGMMPICKRLEQKVYKIKLLRNQSLAKQDFQWLVSRSFKLQVR